jgi:hypothetical protein
LAEREQNPTAIVMASKIMAKGEGSGTLVKETLSTATLALPESVRATVMSPSATVVKGTWACWNGYGLAPLGPLTGALNMPVALAAPLIVTVNCGFALLAISAKKASTRNFVRLEILRRFVDRSRP